MEVHERRKRVVILSHQPEADNEEESEDGDKILFSLQTLKILHNNLTLIFFRPTDSKLCS